MTVQEELMPPEIIRGDPRNRNDFQFEIKFEMILYGKDDATRFDARASARSLRWEDATWVERFN